MIQTRRERDGFARPPRVLAYSFRNSNTLGCVWPGGVTVWLTSDDRRVPVRIEIKQSVASMQLDLQKIESCATLVADAGFGAR